MKFLYYLAAIGNPHIYDKLLILKYNLEYLFTHLNCHFDIIINCYNCGIIVESFMRQFHFLDSILFYHKPGVLTELWLTNPHNKTIDEHDYTLFILDDVQIEKLNIHKMIDIKKKYNIQLLSPKVINSTHNYMNIHNNPITLTNALEIYCLLLSPEDFTNYANVNTVQNKWMWGVDYLFGHFKIKSGLYNKCIVNHKFKNAKTNCEVAQNLMNIYIKKCGFSNFDEIFRKYPIVVKQINY